MIANLLEEQCKGFHELIIKTKLRVNYRSVVSELENSHSFVKGVVRDIKEFLRQYSQKGTDGFIFLDADHDREKAEKYMKLVPEVITMYYNRLAQTELMLTNQSEADLISQS